MKNNIENVTNNAESNVEQSKDKPTKRLHTMLKRE